MLSVNLKEYYKKRKTITLDSLKEMCGNTDSQKQYELISELVENNILIPIKKHGTDGNIQQTLYKKYSIIFQKEDESRVITEVQKLHPKFIANGYLIKRPHEFEKNKEFIIRLNNYICNNIKSKYMSRRERSLIIFDDEKTLDNHISFLKAVGITSDDLCFYDTPEQCYSDYIANRSEKMTLLICENKDIWYNIRKIMFEENKQEFFGTIINGVIFGQGNDITGKGKFTAYAEYLKNKKVYFLYCGDIDKAGFDIYARLKKAAPKLDINLFTPIYRKMLEISHLDKLPHSDDLRDVDLDMSEIYKLFKEWEQEKINQIFSKNLRLPQEIINYHILLENMR